MKKIFCLLMLLSTIDAYSSSPVWFGFGTTTRNYATAQVKDNGDAKKFEFNPTILVGATIPFFSNAFFFSPGLGFTKYSAEDNAARSEIILQYHFSQSITSSFSLQYGFSNIITQIGGKGGTIELNNGSGTATFYTPKETKTTYLASLDFGGEMVFTGNFGSRFQLSIDRFLSSNRRRVSHMLTLNYYY